MMRSELLATLPRHHGHDDCFRAECDNCSDDASVRTDAVSAKASNVSPVRLDRWSFFCCHKFGGSMFERLLPLTASSLLSFCHALVSFGIQMNPSDADDQQEQQKGSQGEKRTILVWSLDNGMHGVAFIHLF